MIFGTGRIIAYFMVGLLLSGEQIAAQGNQEGSIYAAATIPDSLIKHADDVVRNESYILRIKSPAKAELEISRIVTLLDNKAEDLANFDQDYDGFTRISGATVTVYNSLGTKVKQYHQHDMEDVAEGDNEVLVGDSRELQMQVAVHDYPVTIEQDYEIEFSSVLDFPGWLIQGSGESVQSGECQVSVPSNLGIRYLEKNIKIPTTVHQDGTNKVYQWKVLNLKAAIEESNSHWSLYDAPSISISPNRFEYDGLPGDFSSWKNFGSWSWNFYNSSEASSLPEERVAQVRALVAGVSDDRQIIRILYKYLQQHMRYVNISLGIGGYKPFPASYVDERKYGDCKALSNYMHALLEAVHISSYPALVNGNPEGSPVISPKFPENLFNHVILCVPLKRDTIWLDCTDKIGSFDKLGSFTENRMALLITESGGILVSTPASRCLENTFSAYTIVKLRSDESARLESTIRYSGEFRSLFYDFHNLPQNEQQEFLVNHIGLKQPEEFTITKVAGKDPRKFHTELDLSYDKMDEFSTGSHMFMLPGLYDFFIPDLSPNSTRESPFYFEFPFEFQDTLIYELPAGFALDVLPKGIDVGFGEADFRSNYTYDPNHCTISAVLRYRLKLYKIPPGDYQKMYHFFREILDERNQRIVLRKTDS